MPSLELAPLVAVLKSLFGFFLVAVFWALYRHLGRQQFPLWWMWAWAAFALAQAATLFNSEARSPAAVAVVFAGSVASYLRAPLMIFGAWTYRHASVAPPRRWRAWLAAALLLGIAFAAAGAASDTAVARKLLPAAPWVALLGLAMLYSAAVFLGRWRATSSSAALITGLATALDGAMDLIYSAAASLELLAASAPGGSAPFTTATLAGPAWTGLEAAAGLGMALGMVFLLVEERGGTERALAVSETRYRATFEHAAVGLAEVSLDGRLLNVNQKLCDILGYAREELLGRSVLDVTHPDDVEADREYIRRLGASDVYRREKRYVTRSRTTVFAELTIAVVRSEGGAPHHFVTVIEDVTERRLVEQARRAADERYRRLVETMSEGLIVTDLAERIQYVNDRFCEELGYSREELLGLTTFDLVATNADAAVLRPKQARRREGIAEQYEIGLRTKSGAVRWMLVSAAPLVDGSGAIVGTIGTNMDITARREAELLQAAVYRIAQAADRASSPDELFRSVHEVVREIMSARNFYIALHDPARNVVSFPYWVDERDPPPQPRSGALGLTEFVLHSGKPLLCTDEVEERLIKAGEVVQSGSASKVWLGVPLVSGAARLGVMAVQDYADPLAYGERELRVLEFVSSQVAGAIERSRVEADRERAAIEWRRTFDAIDSPMLVLDAAGTVSRLNASALRLAGRSADQITGRNIAALHDAEPWPTAAGLVREAIESQLPSWRQVRAQGGNRTWDVQVTPVTDQDGGLILVMHDVTPLIRLQESLRHSETMSAMGTLVAGVAHEARNPLFSMTATLDAFEARRGAGATGDKHLAVLRTQLNRLTGLMEDLLEYGRPATLELAPEPLEAIVRESAHSCSVLAESRGVTIRVDVPAGLPPVMADRTKMAQVFVNLLTNAIQHSPQGGEVAVAGAEVAEPDDRCLECVVSDQGPGFAPEDLPRVFEPFFSRRKGGTGLGLALVQRLVEQHGGRVTAVNRPGGGADICIRMPCGERLV